MVMICKGVCIRHKAPMMANSLRYSTGQRRCTQCDIFFITDNTNCVCCSSRLRYKSHSKKKPRLNIS